MQAAVVNSLGQPPQFQSFQEPVTADGEVLVQVRAAGLHQIVRAMAGGAHYVAGGELPFVAGVDGVGVLEDGRRVYFLFVRKPWGTMAERAAAPLVNCIPLPDGIEDNLAAAIANPGMSAWISLKERAELMAGESVLILGATGVAGRLAIQVARMLGARRVIGAGRNIQAIEGEVDRAIGLSDPENAVRAAFSAEAAQGIDVVISYLWGRPTELLLEALAKGFKASRTHRTRLVEVGDSAGKTIALTGATLRSIDLTILGSGFGSVSLASVFQVIPGLFQMAADGKLKVNVEPVPLSQVETAWNRGEKGRRVVFTFPA